MSPLEQFLIVFLAASTIGLLREALEAGSSIHVIAGLLAGIGLIVLADRLIGTHTFEPRTLSRAEFDRLVLIVGVLTVHSVPEGVAVGVAFAQLGVEADVTVAGIGLPTLAVAMSLAVAIMNVPEELAIAIPMRTYGIGRRRTVGWAVASSLLPFGLALAAGAMLYPVVHDMLPEAIGRGRELPGRGRRELVTGVVVGFGAMVPLLVVFG